jgi:hypothetical protein
MLRVDRRLAPNAVIEDPMSVRFRDLDTISKSSIVFDFQAFDTHLRLFLVFEIIDRGFEICSKVIVFVKLDIMADVYVATGQQVGWQISTQCQ